MHNHDSLQDLRTAWAANGKAWRYALMIAAGAIPGGYAEPHVPLYRHAILSRMSQLVRSGWTPDWAGQVAYFRSEDTMAHHSELLEEALRHHATSLPPAPVLLATQELRLRAASRPLDFAIEALVLAASTGESLGQSDDFAGYRLASEVLIELRQQALAMDERLNDQQVCPTGDTYIELFALMGIQRP